ncbi:LmbU family transcriptional regulator [Catenulispora pinistramenti]|uniref:LmbU family transcriptional regulator n=1 Tax=Catenulispora pinistramenti TaxID=2705254 RepID=UPI002E78B689|nr:LmbU family transcriptional regulator [Catenulispora pinistramenti]
MVTKVGLGLPPVLDYNIWEQAGIKIARIADSSAWCLGDWLIYGQNRFPDRYRRTISAAGLDYQTLRNYAWVARKFEMARRRVKLSFQHHAEVAALTMEDQDQWLAAAEQHGWSRNDLRTEVRMSRQQLSGTSVVAAPLPKLSPPIEHVDRWREAAALSSQGLEVWIIATLDEVASRALSVRSTLEQPTTTNPEP